MKKKKQKTYVLGAEIVDKKKIVFVYDIPERGTVNVFSRRSEDVGLLWRSYDERRISVVLEYRRATA